MDATPHSPSLVYKTLLFILTFVLVTGCAGIIITVVLGRPFWSDTTTIDPATLFPGLLPMAFPLTIFLVWATLAQLNWSYGRKLGTLLGATILLCVAFSNWSTWLVPQSGWIIGAGSFFLLATTLYRAEHWTAVRPLPRILAVLVVWRFVLWIWSGIATWYSATINGIGPAITTGGAVIPRDNFIYRTLVYGWMQWDSGYYRAIGVDGYSTTDTFPRIAFFPLFPALIRAVRPLIGGDASTAAIVVSSAALVAAVLLLYDLAQDDFGHSVAYRSVVFLLIFPTSFFFVSGYSESLGLALLCGAVWAIRRQRWWVAGIAGFFLALSRLPGIMLALILAIAYLHEHHWQWPSMKRPEFFAVFLPPAGLACFILYQWWRFGQPLAFLHAQAAWENHLRMPWGTPYELLTTIPIYPDWPLRVGQLLVWLCFIGLTIQTLRYMPLVYGTTMVLILLPPYFSTWNESLPRYVLLAFPGFIAMTLTIKRGWLRVLLLGTMILLCAISTMLFVNKFWIA